MTPTERRLLTRIGEAVASLLYARGFYDGSEDVKDTLRDIYTEDAIAQQKLKVPTNSPNRVLSRFPRVVS